MPNYTKIAQTFFWDIPNVWILSKQTLKLFIYKYQVNAKLYLYTTQWNLKMFTWEIMKIQKEKEAGFNLIWNESILIEEKDKE